MFYQENKRAIVQTIASEVTELGPVKVRLSFYVQFKKEVGNATEHMEHFFWNDPPLIVTHLYQIKDSAALDAIVNAKQGGDKQVAKPGVGLGGREDTNGVS